MKTMAIREFLRGGYQELNEPTLVMKHGKPVFTVLPQKRKPVVEGTSVASDALLGSRLKE